MKFILILFLLQSLINTQTEPEATEPQTPQKDNDYLRLNETIILTPTNFDSALQQFQPFLVLFHTTSRDSKRMYQVLLSSVDSIKNLNLGLEIGIFNITDNKEETINNISIERVPEILLFTSKESYIRYVGLKSESAIISWITRQFKDIIFLSKEINEIEEIEYLYEKYLSTTIFVGDFNTQEFEHFKNLTRKYRLTQYRHTNKEELKLHLNLTLEQLDTPQLVILNSQASRNYSSPYNMTTQNAMEHYLELYSTRYFQMFDIDILKDLTSSSESYLFIMLDPEHPRYKPYFTDFDSLETREYFYNEKFIIGVVEPTGHGGASIQDAFEVEYDDCPFVGIMDHEKVENKWQPKKYKMTGEVTMDSIKEFYQKWKNGKVEPFFRSQKQTETQNKINKQLLVKKLVGSNYEEYVFDPNYHFVVYYYSLNCEKCSNVGTIFKKLAAKFSMAGNIWFGEIDMGKNDHQNINVTEVPELHLYPAGEGKQQKPIHLTIKDTAEEIEEQIKAAVEISYKTKEEFQDEFFNGTDPFAQKKKKPPKLQKKSKVLESERTRFYDKEEQKVEDKQEKQEKENEVKIEL